MKINDEEIGIMAEVASLYFEQHFSQQQIADKLYFSRSKVSRLISKAMESKVVEININYPLERILNLENQFRVQFHLNEVIVIRDYSTTYPMLLKRLGSAAVQYLDTAIKDNSSVGISWGQTIYNIVEQIVPNPRKKVKVIQLMGTAEHDANSAYDAPSLVMKFASKFDGTCSQFYSPLVVENDIVRDSLLKEPIIKRVVEEAKRVDVVVTSVGEVSLRKIKAWENYLDEEKWKELTKRGATGVLLAHFLKLNGKIVDETLDKKVIGIQLSDLETIENVVVVAGGANKAKDVLSALNTGYINTLIIDEKLAEAILSLNQKYSFR